MVKDVLKELETKMAASVEHFRKELSRLRTGQANLSIFEDLKVDYYGTKTPINQVATMGIPDPTLITIQPWDSSMLATIEKAIQAADLGLNPLNDGKMLKVPIPPLDEERRKDMAKHIGKIAEEEKAALRVMRRDAKEMVEELEKEKEITEDDKYWGYDKIQEVTDKHNKMVDEMSSVKEKQILEL